MLIPLDQDALKNFQTQGIRYTGSKRLVIPRIHDLISKLDVKKVLDGFSGTTRVSQYLKSFGYDVHCNDVACYSKVLADCYIINCDTVRKELDEKLRYLNSLQPEDGYYSQNYGGSDEGDGLVKSSDGKKKPFQIKNTRKLDAIRPQIEKVANDELEKSILLTSLINALDQVENTLGHQVSYLSKWAPRSYADLTLKRPLLIAGRGKYKVFCGDVKNIKEKYDLAYFDPPYNTNNTHTPTTRVRYASYYHFWTTIVKNDYPKVFGAANRREDCSSDSLPGAISKYESTRYEEVASEIENLISAINSRYVLFSYSNKGKVSVEDLVGILSKFGSVKVERFTHKEHVQKALTSNREWLGDQSSNYEYLFLLEKI
jgi:adenine-specific DNA-methyltransferase